MKVPPHTRGGLFYTMGVDKAAAGGSYTKHYASTVNGIWVGDLIIDAAEADSLATLTKLARWRVYATQACVQCGAYYTIGRHEPLNLVPVAASPYCPRHAYLDGPKNRRTRKGRKAKRVDT